MLLETSNDDEATADFEIHLKNISLEHIDIHELDEATNTDVETTFIGEIVVLEGKIFRQPLFILIQS